MAVQECAGALSISQIQKQKRAALEAARFVLRDVIRAISFLPARRAFAAASPVLQPAVEAEPQQEAVTAVPVSPQGEAAAQVVRPVAAAVQAARLAVVAQAVAQPVEAQSAAVKPDAVALQAAEVAALPGAAVLPVEKVAAPIAVAEPVVTAVEFAAQLDAPASPAAARQDAGGRIAERDAAAAEPMTAAVRTVPAHPHPTAGRDAGRHSGLAAAACRKTASLATVAAALPASAVAAVAAAVEHLARRAAA